RRKVGVAVEQPDDRLLGVEFSQQFGQKVAGDEHNFANRLAQMHFSLAQEAPGFFLYPTARSSSAVDGLQNSRAGIVQPQVFVGTLVANLPRPIRPDPPGQLSTPGGDFEAVQAVGKSQRQPPRMSLVQGQVSLN